MKNKIYSQYPWLSYNEECEVLVIGSGLTGAFCLDNLSKNGINCVMVSQKPIGFSSNPTNSICQYENEVMLSELCVSHSKEQGVHFFKQCEQALNEIELLCKDMEDVGFKRRDSLVYSNTTANVDRLHCEYLLRRHNGIDVTFLDKASGGERYSFELSGGILAKNQAAQLDDYALCHSLAKASEKLGCRIFENTTVTQIKVTDAGYDVITAYGNKIAAKKIILCVGKSVVDYQDDVGDIKTTFTIITNPLESFSGYASRAIVKNIDKNITLHTTDDNNAVISGLDCSLLKEQSHFGKIIGITRLIERKHSELEEILNSMLIGIGTKDIVDKFTSEYLKTQTLIPVSTRLESHDDVFLATPSSINGLIYAYLVAGKICGEICTLQQNAASVTAEF